MWGTRASIPARRKLSSYDMSRALWVCCLLAAFASAQAPEVVVACDGLPADRVSAEGDASVLRDPAKVKIGKAAWRVAPKAGVKFYGPAAADIPTRGRPALVCVLFLEGDRPRDFRFKLDDAASGKAQNDAAVEYRSVAPGWNEISLSLVDRTTSAGRALDFSASVKQLQISKRAEDNDPAIILDGLLLGITAPPTASRPRQAPPVPGNPSPGPSAETPPTPKEHAAKKKLAAAVAAEKDGQKRAALLRDPAAGLDALGDLLRAEFALKLLSDDAAPRVRRAAREALSRTATAAGSSALETGLKTAAGQTLYELLFSAAASPTPSLRGLAIARALDPKTSSAERTAVLTGLARKGSVDASALAAVCPENGPWPQRAAYVRALRTGAVKQSIDPLIEVLSAPGSERVATDAEEALIALTGQDFGTNAPAWKAWWDVQRDKAKIADSGRRTGGGYATFYGVTVPKGRVAFVIDTSGSMREPAEGANLADYVAKAKHLQGMELKTRLDLAKAELAHAALSLKNGSFFGLVSFSTDRQWLTEGLEKVDDLLRTRLKKRISGLGPGGTTNVWAGLHAAFFPGKEPGERDWQDGPDTIFLLSDGNPSSGFYSDREELRDEVLAWNLSRAIKIHCVNVGDADVQMLRAFTQSSGGVLLDLRSDRPAPKPAK